MGPCILSDVGAAPWWLLSVIFLGAAAGRALRPRGGRSRVGGRLATALILLSLSIGAAAAGLITFSSLTPPPRLDLLVLGCLAVISLLGFALPKLVGFPLLILSSLGILTFLMVIVAPLSPPGNLELLRFRALNGGGLQIEFPGVRTWDVERRGDDSVSCRIAVCNFEEPVPLWGGSARVAVFDAGVGRNVVRGRGRSLLERLLDSRDGELMLPGISIKLFELEVPDRLLDSGIRFSLWLRESTLVFEP